jgi:hypothetical protein
MIKSEPGVPSEGVAKKLPERTDAFLRMQQPGSIGPPSAYPHTALEVALVQPQFSGWLVQCQAVHQSKKHLVDRLIRIQAQLIWSEENSLLDKTMLL